MKTILMVAVIGLLAAATQAQIIHIPDDYPTIQQGIDATNNGDTVLVSPGTYVEGISFNGKNITVASLVLTTQDTSYISRTIIDGNQYGFVVAFWQEEDITAILCGFTIKNGNGGIYCDHSSPTLCNLIIRENSTPVGGWGPSPGGAGISCINANPVIKDVIITNNTCSVFGGGMSCRQNSYPFLSNITIKHNTSHSQGGGIFCSGSAPVFDTLNRCNIFNNSALEGNDLYTDTLLAVTVDTFSVGNPTDFHAAPIADFSFKILHGRSVQVNADLYVSPGGDDNNSGLTAADPLKSVQYAFSIIRADSLNRNTVRLLEGIYTPFSCPGLFPLDVPDYIDLKGVSRTAVILDAKDASRVLQVMDNTSNHISGMTITGGYILGCGGGGILCDQSKPVFEDLIITGNTAQAGGIGMNICGIGGGGILCLDSDPIFKDVIVTGNYSFMEVDGSTGLFGGHGGGLYFKNSTPLLQNVTVTANGASYHGGGISFMGSEPRFDSINRCNIYGNVASGHPGQFGGSDLYADTFIELVVDTFTVSVPNAFHALPLSNFSFDIIHGLHQQISANLYISPWGDNRNSGLTPGEPLRNIQCAFSFMQSDSLNPRTIHLLEGTYSRMNSGEFYPLRLPGYTSIEGISQQSVILDADSTKYEAIQLINSPGVRITGITINGGSHHIGSSTGITSYNANPSIRDVIFSNNTLGINCLFSDLALENVIISSDDASNGGSGIYCGYFPSSDKISLKNVTMVNARPTSGYAISGAGANTMIVNSILRNHIPYEIIGGTPVVNYSNVEGGWPGEGNIDADPLFDTTGIYPLALRNGSPCINAGTPDTTGYNFPLTDLAGNPRIWGGRIDMGAYEWNNVGSAEIRFPNYELQVKNFPNPTSQSTSISYNLKESGNVTIRVFDSYGQFVEKPLSAHQAKGEQQVPWDAGNLPAGIYFYRIQAGREVGGGKILLVK